MVLTAIAQTATGFAITENLFSVFLNVGVAIYAVILSIKLTTKTAMEKEHKEEHERMNTTIQEHTNKIGMNKHEIANVKQAQELSCAEQTQNTRLLIQMASGLKALMSVNHIDPNIYFDK